MSSCCDDGFFSFYGFVAGFVIGACTVGGGVHFSWKDDMVERGLAEYNQQTGDWQWKEEYKLEKDNEN